jgi:hypothetical protein
MTATAKAISRKGPRPGERWRVLLVVGLLLGLLALALTVGAQTLATVERKPPPPSEKELRTGKLIVTPPQGNDCRQKQFDNVTGKFQDLGTLPCDSVGNAGHGSGGISRIEAVRKSFRR